VIALSLAAQAWPASNEAPRSVTQRGALIVLLWLFCSIHKQRTPFRALMPLMVSAVEFFWLRGRV
jgi:hypothetical protein